MKSRLPQEIINLVVDAISAGNKAELSRVALTARVFLHQAQSQKLFRSVNLEVSHCFKQIAADLDAFHAILLQSPNIKFYIREIFVNSLVFSETMDLEGTLPRTFPCPVWEEAD
ncbi:hypothetical protein M413DRAFT_31069 [Hebeloma cylindrosporum]|uniref:F-box domain-containing protein n=1 Tax=Hebeloma cylindrosporum TaxID=76867 RepID=A0A0C2XGZ9_HEBCY|nr:hypothetical protein M413DRAFT_31069 [Hebeloma cylindrosporum h7]